jgi:hypothetical protein
VNCPTCGSPVVVVSDRDGTSHYEPESFPIRSVMRERDRYRDRCIEQQKIIESMEASHGSPNPSETPLSPH